MQVFNTKISSEITTYNQMVQSIAISKETAYLDMIKSSIDSETNHIFGCNNGKWPWIDSTTHVTLITLLTILIHLQLFENNNW